jgi:transcriptional regulator with XRE-family HTH domain
MQTLHELRKEKQIRMMDIAAQLNISQGHYSNLEHGRRHMSDELLEKVSQALGEPKERVASAAQANAVESLKLRSWLSNIRINGLPLVKAFKYHLESIGMDLAAADNADLKKELRTFIEKNITYSLLAEFSENKQLIEQIRSKLNGENIVKTESDNLHGQPTGNE